MALETCRKMKKLTARDKGKGTIASLAETISAREIHHWAKSPWNAVRQNRSEDLVYGHFSWLFLHVCNLYYYEILISEWVRNAEYMISPLYDVTCLTRLTYMG